MLTRHCLPVCLSACLPVRFHGETPPYPYPIPIYIFYPHPRGFRLPMNQFAPMDLFLLLRLLMVGARIVSHCVPSQVLASLIYSASALHAAVNFPQKPTTSFTPNTPGSVYLPPPTDKVRCSCSTLD